MYQQEEISSFGVYTVYIWCGKKIKSLTNIFDYENSNFCFYSAGIATTLFSASIKPSWIKQVYTKFLGDYQKALNETHYY